MAVTLYFTITLYSSRDIFLVIITPVLRGLNFFFLFFFTEGYGTEVTSDQDFPIYTEYPHPLFPAMHQDE